MAASPFIPGRICRVAILAATLTVGACQPPASCPESSFLQLYRRDTEQSSEYFPQLFAQTRELGFPAAILQWSSYDDFRLHAPHSSPKNELSAPLTGIVQSACAAGVSLWVGLHYDSRFWQHMAGEPEQVRGYLQRRLADMQQQLPVLNAVIERANVPANCLRGWYISDEIDELSFADPDRRAALLEYLDSTSRFLRTLRPDWPVAISGFSNGSLSPKDYAQFWKGILIKAEIDRLYFQDGVGAGKLTTDVTAGYFRVLARMGKRNDKTIVPLIELFQIEQAPDQDQIQSVVLSSAPPRRVREQIEQLRQARAGQFSVFAANPYLMDRSRSAARTLSEYWQKDVLTACLAKKKTSPDRAVR
jgi:hypothetical protein